MSFLRLTKAVALFVAAASLVRAQETPTPSPTPSPTPCGLLTRCPPNQECVPENPECTDGPRCLGTCDYRPCPILDIPDPRSCKPGSECMEDPRVYTYPERDPPGICVPTDVPLCGGFVPQECPDGLECFYLLGADYGICLEE